MLGALWTAFNRRQFCVKLLLAPDVELSHRTNETNVELPMNYFAVDVRPSLPHLSTMISIVKQSKTIKHF